ncbi:MAG: UDP-N-acetylmuramate dehydrogenase [Caldilineaceae bacterium]|nr:UDP-N-acetylmuramate dehydrogenase [Caldilineaceae bacterium]
MIAVAEPVVKESAPALDAPATFGVQIERDVSLAAMTTMRVGGAADFFATVTQTHHLLKLVRWARAVDLPYLILGGGSNILISDRGVRGLVIHNRCRHVRIDAPPCCNVVHDDGMYLMAESGAAMAGAARTSVRAGLTGLEWAVSVPGTVGGAVVGNAGAHGGEVKDCLHTALLVDAAGEVQEYTKADFAYAYRTSSLKQNRRQEDGLPQPLRAGFGPVLLSANFRLLPADVEEVTARADGFLGHRRRTQPVEASLGSTFVNPPGDYAGRLIEAAGLKRACVGGAVVSELHANFITNPGGVGHATAQDVIDLIQMIRTTVVAHFGISLEVEVQLVGEW